MKDEEKLFKQYNLISLHSKDVITKKYWPIFIMSAFAKPLKTETNWIQTDLSWSEAFI